MWLIAVAFDLHDSFYAVVVWQPPASLHYFTVSTLKMRQLAVRHHPISNLGRNHPKGAEEAHLSLHQNLRKPSNLYQP
jgi:hypothetical protein